MGLEVKKTGDHHQSLANKKEFQMQSNKQRDYSKRLDIAARAGWLYFVADYKQDQIAQILHVSRQTAQRLVSMAKKEKLIGFRLQHPLMHCMDLAEQLTKKFWLNKCDVVPSVSEDMESVVGLAQAGAATMDHEFDVPDGTLIGVGTGRTHARSHHRCIVYIL